MTDSDFSEYPGCDPVPRAAPAHFLCPKCDTVIELWTDEAVGECSSCNTYFKKSQLSSIPDTLLGTLKDNNTNLKRLIQDALELGATEATIISTKNIVIDNDLADKCREPRCENYGLSKSCPPHVSGPSALRKQIEKYSRAVFFKIDVPSEILFSSERRELFQLLHEIAAGIERSAVGIGFTDAQAYAGGSCKSIFCHEHLECLALSEKGTCRHPQYARPSMSGFGINVAELFKTAGWSIGWVTPKPDAPTIKMANICGLVLVY
jgi:predicted metal-binding protein